MNEIKIIPVDGETDLYHTYTHQTDPQPCYLELDPESDPPTVQADWDGEIGGAVPMKVWHGRIRRYSIPAMLGSEAEALMEDLLPLFKRVVAGYECKWDGNNYVGQLTEDAESAEYEIEHHIKDLPDSELQVWDAGDWLSGVDAAQELGITADTTDDEIVALAKRVEDEAYDEGVQKVMGLEHYLTGLRDQLREDGGSDE